MDVSQKDSCQELLKLLLDIRAENPQVVTRFFETGRGTGADILALTFGGCYENLQHALAN